MIFLCLKPLNGVLSGTENTLKIPSVAYMILSLPIFPATSFCPLIWSTLALLASRSNFSFTSGPLHPCLFPFSSLSICYQSFRLELKFYYFLSLNQISPLIFHHALNDTSSCPFLLLDRNFLKVRLCTFFSSSVMLVPSTMSGLHWEFHEYLLCHQCLKKLQLL